MNANRDALTLKIQQGKEQLKRLTGQKRLACLLKLDLFQIAKFHSLAIAVEILDENLDLIETTDTEEAAQLMTINAYFASMKVDMDDAKVYVDKALAKARAVGSLKAEAMALAIKGYHKDSEKQYEKAAVWYIMALRHIPAIYKANVLRELGAAYGKCGKYELAWHYFNEAIEQTKKLIDDESICRESKANLLEIQADIWSRLATIHESIDDLDGAEAAHDKAIGMAREHGFAWELYRALSRKAKFFILKNDYKSAEEYLIEAGKLSAEKYDPRVPFYVAHDWARLYRLTANNNDDLQKALEKYEEILYGGLENMEEMDKYILTVMRNMPLLFDEVTTGIYECLMGIGKVLPAEFLNRAIHEYEEVMMESGIYKEADKQEKLNIEEKNIKDTLTSIFQKMPLTIRYRHVVANYDPDKDKAKYKIEGKKSRLRSIRAFFILKCLELRIGECVPREAIQDFLELNGITVNEEGGSSGIRTTIDRIREKLGLTEYIRTCEPHGAGWRLLPLKPARHSR
jgi:tetratricopeptide (TPR) repeat protein